MTKTINTNPSSILAKLRNLARERYANLPANTMLLLYAQQGFLARLESSRYQGQFVLKGALSLFVRYDNAARPTEDIDLAANGLPNSVEAIQAAIAEICAITFEDGLSFDPSGIRARVINEALTYSGVEIVIEATLGSSRAKLKLDVSFGNVITPEPIQLAFPALLLPKQVSVRVYPLETVIAEKFAALVEIGEATTRMKDVYDLLTILTTQEFDAAIVIQALTRSFKARGTPMNAIGVTLGGEFAHAPELTTRWRQYLNRTRFVAPDFAACMRLIGAFYHPLLLENQQQGTWQPSQRCWV
jgi:predicted nucleotidyltransferase component of viral defense system